MVHRVALLTACGLLVATVATSSPPSGANTSYQKTPLRLVGYRAGIIDPAGIFTVTARDLGGNPFPNVNVTIKLGNCTDTHIADPAYQASGSAGLLCATCPSPLIVDPVNRTVSTITNTSGVAVFDLVGAITPSRTPAVLDGPNFAPAKCAEIWFLSFNIKVGTVQVVAFDQDGSNGVDAIDLSLWAEDFFNLAPNSSLRAASDYDARNGVDGVDLSQLAIEFFSNNSLTTIPAFAW